MAYTVSEGFGIKTQWPTFPGWLPSLSLLRSLWKPSEKGPGIPRYSLSPAWPSPSYQLRGKKLEVPGWDQKLKTHMGTGAGA